MMTHPMIPVDSPRRAAGSPTPTRGWVLAVILIVACLGTMTASGNAPALGPAVPIDAYTQVLDWSALMSQAASGTIVFTHLANTYTVELSPSHLDTTHTRFFEEGPGGLVRELPRPNVATYAAKISSFPGEEGVLTIGVDYIRGFLPYVDCGIIQIEPTKKLDASRLAVTSYTTTTAGASSSSCMSVVDQDEQWIRLVLDADRYFSAAFAGDTAYAHQQNILASADNAYLGANIKFTIVEQWKWTSGGPSASSACSEWTEHKNHWVGSAHHRATVRDIVLLFTHRNIGGCVVGVGDPGSLDDAPNWSYAVASTDVGASDKYYAAHEMAHNMAVADNSGQATSTTCSSVSGWTWVYLMHSRSGDTCRYLDFDTANEGVLRTCVEDRPNC